MPRTTKTLPRHTRKIGEEAKFGPIKFDNMISFHELLATLLLVFIGTGCLVVNGGSSNVLLVAVTFGVTVGVLVGATDGAQMNPAVTLAMLLDGSVNVMQAIKLLYDRRRDINLKPKITHGVLVRIS